MQADNTQNPNMCDSNAELEVLLFYGEIYTAALFNFFKI